MQIKKYKFIITLHNHTMITNNNLSYFFNLKLLLQKLFLSIFREEFHGAHSPSE